MSNNAWLISTNVKQNEQLIHHDSIHPRGTLRQSLVVAEEIVLTIGLRTPLRSALHHQMSGAASTARPRRPITMIVSEPGNGSVSGSVSGSGTDSGSIAVDIAPSGTPARRT